MQRKYIKNDNLCNKIDIIHLTSALFSDLTGKMFTFPQETNSAYVRLTTAEREFGTLTVCHR